MFTISMQHKIEKTAQIRQHIAFQREILSPYRIQQNVIMNAHVSSLGESSPLHQTEISL